MWHVRQESVETLPETARPFTHSVDVVNQYDHGAFTDANDPDKDVRNQVIQWCSTNCSLPAMVGGYSLVCFQNEEDALLFYFTFKR